MKNSLKMSTIPLESWILIVLRNKKKFHLISLSYPDFQIKARVEVSWI